MRPRAAVGAGVVGAGCALGAVELSAALLDRTPPALTPAVISGVLGAAIGTVVTLWLLDRAPGRAERPVTGGLDRRQFLATAALGGLAIGVASIGAWLRARVPAASARRRGTLPVAD